MSAADDADGPARKRTADHVDRGSAGDRPGGAEAEKAAPFDELVDRATRGDRPALEALMPLVYGELRRLAAHYLRGERPGQTLQPTALVHEAYLRLLKDRPERWQNRAHFSAIAAHSMRQILIERARARDALKRGGGQPRVTFDEGLRAAAPERAIDLVALDAALTRLAALDAGQARIVELRFFGGLSIEETAEAVGVSPATVKRHWARARAWLARELESA
jgi:RNA polymerase sigma factor (TIGR02999 family)